MKVAKLTSGISNFPVTNLRDPDTLHIGCFRNKLKTCPFFTLISEVRMPSKNVIVTLSIKHCWLKILFNSYESIKFRRARQDVYDKINKINEYSGCVEANF